MCAYDSDTPLPLKRKSFGFYFRPALNSRFEMFPLFRILLFYKALSTWRIFYNKFGEIFLFHDAYITKVLQINSTYSTAKIYHTEWPLALYDRARLCNRLTFKRLWDSEKRDGLVFAKNSSYFSTLGSTISGKLCTERWSCPCVYHADTTGKRQQSSI